MTGEQPHGGADAVHKQQTDCYALQFSSCCAEHSSWMQSGISSAVDKVQKPNVSPPALLSRLSWCPWDAEVLHWPIYPGGFILHDCVRLLCCLATLCLLCRACVRFRFLQRPEYITPNTRFVFREGRTKGIGVVVGCDQGRGSSNGTAGGSSMTPQQAAGAAAASARGRQQPAAAS